MTFYISKELYSKEVVLKTCYKYTDDYYVHLDLDVTRYIINITGKDGCDTSIENDFKNSLIEFANREIVFKQTKNIRELLFARSMASSIIYENSSNDEIPLNVDDNSAMKDWFEDE